MKVINLHSKENVFQSGSPKKKMKSRSTRKSDTSDDDLMPTTKTKSRNRSSVTMNSRKTKNSWSDNEDFDNDPNNVFTEDGVDHLRPSRSLIKDERNEKHSTSRKRSKSQTYNPINLAQSPSPLHRQLPNSDEESILSSNTTQLPPTPTPNSPSLLKSPFPVKYMHLPPSIYAKNDLVQKNEKKLESDQVRNSKYLIKLMVHFIGIILFILLFLWTFESMILPYCSINDSETDGHDLKKNDNIISALLFSRPSCIKLPNHVIRLSSDQKNILECEEGYEIEKANIFHPLSNQCIRDQRASQREYLIHSMVESIEIAIKNEAGRFICDRWSYWERRIFRRNGWNALKQKHGIYVYEEDIQMKIKGQEVEIELK